ncbi:MAG: PIG-L family deacetylase, partial [Candidatus Dojkabacteria bacterium]
VIILKLHPVRLPNLKLSNIKRKGIKNVLFIYPHPDDEVMSAGGLICKMSRDPELNVFVVDITKGERGDEIMKVTPKVLGAIREQEYYKALFTVGIGNAEIWDFPDGSVPAKVKELKKTIEKYIEENKIDFVITYERFGIYGHQDHVNLSKVIYEISKENKKLKVLYSTISPQIAKMINIKDGIKGLELEDFESNEVPEMKLPIYSELLTKYRALRKYKSQNLSQKYPLWVTILMSPYEYYTTKYAQSTNKEIQS